MARRLVNTVVSIALLGCAACASPPPKHFGEVVPQLAVGSGSSQLLIYTLERAGVVVDLDDRWIGYLVTDSAYQCSFLFADASPGRHRLTLRMDNATSTPDVDNITPRDERWVVLPRDERLYLRVASQRDLLFSKPTLIDSDGAVPDGCVYVGPEDELARRGVAP